MTKKVTVNDIATQLGVSRATVSRALNGAEGVGAVLRKQICEYAESVGYHAKQTEMEPRDQKQNRSKVIGLVYGDVRNPFYAELTYYIQQELHKFGYMVMILNSEYFEEREREFIYLAQKYQLAGLLLVTIQTNLQQLNDSNHFVPVVFVNRTPESSEYDSVTLDNFEAGYQAAMHLINFGHSHIGFVTGPSESSASMKRLEGYKQAMNNYYLPIAEEDVIEGDLKLQTGYAVAERLMSQEKPPTAVIFGNDLMAIGFMDWCKEQGIGVPEKVSVVGFDNIDFSSLHGIELTSISQHVHEMGKTAAQLIVRRIEEPDADVRRVILKPTLMQRKSTDIQNTDEN